MIASRSHYFLNVGGEGAVMIGFKDIALRVNP
jgi:hypothetical protein